MCNVSTQMIKLKSQGTSGLEITRGISLRYSGGVRILVKDSILTYLSVVCVDEDIIWMSFTGIKDPDQVFNVCACYLPTSNSRGDTSHEFFDLLRCQF